MQRISYGYRIALERFGYRLRGWLQLTIIAAVITAAIIIDLLVQQTLRTLVVLTLWISACGAVELFLTRILHLMVPLIAPLAVALLGPVLIIWLIEILLLPDLLTYGPSSE